MFVRQLDLFPPSDSAARKTYKSQIVLAPKIDAYLINVLGEQLKRAIDTRRYLSRVSFTAFIGQRTRANVFVDGWCSR